MDIFDQKEFNDFIIRQEVIGLFDEPVELKSGRKSNWYINWRKVSDDVYLFDKLTDYIIAFVEHLKLKPDCFCGVPEGATKISLITQFKWAKAQPNYDLGVYPLAMARGSEKEHGDPKDKYFIGSPKGRTLIIEDVTTTGNSMLATLDKLIHMEVPVIGCLGITNRNEKRDDNKTVRAVVEERGVEYYSMSNALDLLPEVCDKFQPDVKILNYLRKYFKLYGTEEINLNESSEEIDKQG